METSTKEQRQEKSNSREKEPLTWLLSVRVQPGVWCDTHHLQSAGEAPWIERSWESLGVACRGWESLGHGGEEHLWDCTRKLLGCLEESKVRVRGDKDGLIKKKQKHMGLNWPSWVLVSMLVWLHLAPDHLGLSCICQLYFNYFLCVRVTSIFHVYTCVSWPECHQLGMGGHKSQEPVCSRCSSWGDESTHCMRICVVTSKQQARAGGSQVLEQPWVQEGKWRDQRISELAAGETKGFQSPAEETVVGLATGKATTLD